MTTLKTVLSKLFTHLKILGDQFLKAALLIALFIGTFYLYKSSTDKTIKEGIVIAKEGETEKQQKVTIVNGEDTTYFMLKRVVSDTINIGDWFIFDPSKEEKSKKR